MVPNEGGNKCVSVDPWIFGRSLERERKTHAYEGSAVAGRDSLTPAMRFRSSEKRTSFLRLVFFSPERHAQWYVKVASCEFDETKAP